MTKKINLYWYRHKEGQGNFGDELNPYIVEKLSGENVNYIDVRYIYDNKWLAIKVLLKALLDLKINLVFFFKYVYYNLINKPKVLISIGSVLHYSHANTNLIWGAGILQSTVKFTGGVFYAVRGKYSQQKVENLGFKAPDVLGDPALLLPLVYNPSKIKKYKIGIIPHYQHFADLQNLFPHEVLVINLLDEIETVIDQIASCELTISTSLHGIIVSHSYAVPSIWATFSETKKKLAGDDIKFKDYFSSVNLREYNPFKLSNIEEFSVENIVNIINNEYYDVILPEKENITWIQKKLLTVVPFTLKKEFKN